MKKICVIAVHPDDETLGCGGTLLKHFKNGDDIYCIFVTSGNEKQKKYIDKISKEYSFKNVFNLGLEELRLSDISLNDIIPLISKIFKEVKPEIIYMPNRSDVHSDHKAIFNAVLSCTKSFRYPFIRKVLMMEVISETDFSLGLPETMFIPNYYVDISETFEQKIQIMKMYESEMLEYPHTRNESTMTALNRYRGSLIGTEYAEAFMAIKIVE